LEYLRLTAGRSHAEIMSALEELVGRMLLAEATQGYRFLHDIIRQHVEESLGQVRRQLLHRRAGRAYQRLNPDASPALAYHFELGGDLQKALHYHELAAHHAHELFAWRLAEFHQGKILELLERIEPGSEPPHPVR
jgi:predicted ATPase